MKNEIYEEMKLIDIKKNEVETSEGKTISYSTTFENKLDELKIVLNTKQKPDLPIGQVFDITFSTTQTTLNTNEH